MVDKGRGSDKLHFRYKSYFVGQKMVNQFTSKNLPLKLLYVKILKERIKRQIVKFELMR